MYSSSKVIVSLKKLFFLIFLLCASSTFLLHLRKKIVTWHEIDVYILYFNLYNSFLYLWKLCHWDDGLRDSLSSYFNFLTWQKMNHSCVIYISSSLIKNIYFPKAFANLPCVHIWLRSRKNISNRTKALINIRHLSAASSLPFIFSSLSFSVWLYYFFVLMKKI